MLSTTTIPQVLKEEKHTPHAVAYSVLELAPGPGYSSSGEAPEIKKRLEAYSQPSPITESDIKEKLNRATQKRLNVLRNRVGPVSPRVAEERRRLALERKRAIDKETQQQLKKSEQEKLLADQKRKQTTEERQQKLRQHLARVESIAKQQAHIRKTSAEKLKCEIENKIGKANEMRENQLEKVKSVAHYSAEKKKPSAGNSYIAHENITLPAHSQNQPGSEEK